MRNIQLRIADCGLRSGLRNGEPRRSIATRTPRRQGRLIFALLGVLALWWFIPSIASVSAQAIAANPIRPTFSTNAYFVAKDYVELEAGYTQTTPGSVNRSPITVKYGAAPWLELQVATNGLVLNQQTASGSGQLTGMGDLSFGLKHRLLKETRTRPILSLFHVVKLPTADSAKGLGTGKTDYTFAILASKTVSPLSVTLHGAMNVIGDAVGTNTQFHAILYMGYTLTPRIAVFAEFFDLIPTRSGDKNMLTSDYGFYITAMPRLVFDVGVERGLRASAADYSLNVGLTATLCKVK